MQRRQHFYGHGPPKYDETLHDHENPLDDDASMTMLLPCRVDMCDSCEIT